MATKTATRKPPITKWFTHWRGLKDQTEFTGKEQKTFRDKIVDAVLKYGEKDDKGSFWYTLPHPVEFPDWEGKVHIYKKVKAERHLTPAQPTPDPELALELLQKKNLWLTAKELKEIQELQVRCPYAVISVDIDADAVAQAWYRDELTTKEYESVLSEQVESFQLKPQE